MDDGGGPFDDGDWSEEVRALAAAKMADFNEALARAGGDRNEALRLMTEKTLRGGHVPSWHPERVEFVPGIPPWHPESGPEEGPPDGGVREPRRPAPNAPSGFEALDEPNSE